MYFIYIEGKNMCSPFLFNIKCGLLNYTCIYIHDMLISYNLIIRVIHKRKNNNLYVKWVFISCKIFKR